MRVLASGTGKGQGLNWEIKIQSSHAAAAQSGSEQIPSGEILLEGELMVPVGATGVVLLPNSRFEKELTMGRMIIQPWISVVLALCFMAPTVQCQRGLSVSLQKPDTRPFNMLVLGDSIMWGQGLRSENKAWSQMKIWLAQRTGRTVNEKIEAHSGAVVENETSEQSSEQSSVPVDGEVNVARPTIIHQLERAQRYYVNAREVDLVLVSGCANDVGTKNVLNAAKTTEEIRLLTYEQTRTATSKTFASSVAHLLGR